MSASLCVKSSFKENTPVFHVLRQFSSKHPSNNPRSRIISIHLVASRALHDHGGPHRQRRHRQHGYNHPFWTGELGVHAQDDVFFVRDALEDLVHTLGTQQNFLLLGILVDVLPLGVQLQA